MTDAPQRHVGSALRRFFGVPLRRQTYRNLAYLALAFPLGMLYFLGISIGLSTGLALATTLVGIPLVVATLAAVVGVAHFEANLAAWLLDVEVDSPGVLRRFEWEFTSLDDAIATTKRLLTASTTWAGLVLVAAKFVFGLVAFTALVTAGTVGWALLSAPVFYDASGVAYGTGSIVVDTMGEALGVAALGVMVLLGSLHVLNGLARLGGFTTTVLVGSETTQEKAPESADSG